MAYIGMGNNKLICFLIHLEKTDPERYNAIKRKAYGYIKEHAADITYMNATISVSEALSIMEFIYGIIKFIIDKLSNKEKSRDEEIAEFLSKYTRMELYESVRTVDCMSPKEKAQYLLDHEV